MLADGARLVDRLLGGRAAVRRRLDAPAATSTVEDFRVEQVVWGGLGLLRRWRCWRQRGSALAARLNVLSAVLLVRRRRWSAACSARDWWLTQQVQRREELLLAEFPASPSCSRWR